MQYVGFWGRFGAYWIDVLVISPLAIAAIWLSPYKYYYVAIGLPGATASRTRTGMFLPEFVVLLSLLSVVTAGCGAARRAEMVAANAPTADVAGVWTGSAGTGGMSVPVTMTLNQNGSSVAGWASPGSRIER